MDLTVIGQRIKLAREAAHLTQEDLAKAVDCTAKHIGAIERGVKTPSLDTFIIIADLLLQDVLENPVDSIAGEFAAATAPLTDDMRKRILKALRAFAEDEA